MEDFVPWVVPWGVSHGTTHGTYTIGYPRRHTMAYILWHSMGRPVGYSMEGSPRGTPRNQCMPHMRSWCPIGEPHGIPHGISRATLLWKTRTPFGTLHTVEYTMGRLFSMEHPNGPLSHGAPEPSPRNVVTYTRNKKYIVPDAWVMAQYKYRTVLFVPGMWHDAL